MHAMLISISRTKLTFLFIRQIFIESYQGHRKWNWHCVGDVLVFGLLGPGWPEGCFTGDLRSLEY